MDLLSDDAAHDGAAMLERDGRLVRNRSEQSLLRIAERRVAVADELSDLPALPAQRQPDGVLAGAALGPRDGAVLENECGARRADRVDRRLDDRLERFLEVERLGDRFGDRSQGF